MIAKQCDGPQREGGTGMYYCPFNPGADEWNCGECARQWSLAIDLAVDCALEEEAERDVWGGE